MVDALKEVLHASGFERPNPMQQAVVDRGLLEGKSMVVAASTASGKTMLAEAAALDAIMNRGKKVVYIVPLKALASEKYEDFKERYESLGLRIAISIGDLDSTDPWLANYDLIIVTSEKMDSLLRHGIPWVQSIGLVVVDEIHLLNDPGRGPTLDIVITMLKQVSDPMILGLSATISNYKELAEWMGAKAVKSDYRPVDLYRGIFFDGKVSFVPHRELEMGDGENPLGMMIENTLEKGKQSIVFVSTRRGTETAAENLGKVIERKLDASTRAALFEVSQAVLNALGHPTRQCSRLADCIKTGTAFHHAGLPAKQRQIVESEFRKGAIKAVTATPTLAFGVNLPAYRVIIRDLKRYASFGMDYLPILEIMQMCGRAGRPKYDDEGEAIMVAKNKAEAMYAWDNYINGEPEKITSKLGVEPVLRTHILALISSGLTPTRKELLGFFARTFYAHQYKDLSELEKILEKVVTMLKDFAFVQGDVEDKDAGEFRTASSIAQDTLEGLRPTKMGKRVSELYLDPLTAHELIKGLQEAGSKGSLELFSLLHMISNTLEMKPLVSVRKGDYDLLNETVNRYGNKLLGRVPNEWDIDYDDFMKSVKTALVFQAWAHELGEDRILDDFAVTPGELRARLSNSDWLLYATGEIALLLGLMDMLRDIKKARIRVKYGVREELLPLVKLKGIGRVRARMLYKAGFRKLSDLRNASIEQIERAVGSKVAESVKGQL